MLGEGRGEVLSEIVTDSVLAITGGCHSVRSAEPLYELQGITPAGIAVSTKDAYSGIRPHMPQMPLREVLARPVEEWDGLLVNDFEETVFAKYPELAAIKKSLYDSGAVNACMSGSGSALLALYKNRE